MRGLTSTPTVPNQIRIDSAHRNEIQARSGGHAVCLLGVTNNTNNYGVRVLLSGAVEALAQNDPDVVVRVLDYGRESACWTESTRAGEIRVEVINLRYSWRIHLPNNVFRVMTIVGLSLLLPNRKARERLLCRNHWLKAVLETRVCYSLAGGDSFSDIYGFGRLLYIALPQILVLLLRKPLVQLPQTYGPFASGASRLIARALLCRSHTIWSRDESSVNRIQELLGTNSPPVGVMPDLGLLMSPGDLPDDDLRLIRELSQQRPLIGLNVSKLLYMGGYSRKNMFGLKDDYPNLTRQLTTFLIDQLGATVMLIPHVAGEAESEESEITLNRQLLKEWKPVFGDRIWFVDKPFTHRQIKAMIGQCDLFVGGRMHACIAALSQRVPTIALAYSDKFAGMFKTVGVQDLVVDLRVHDTASVMKFTARVYERRKEIRNRLCAGLPTVERQSLELFAARP